MRTLSLSVFLVLSLLAAPVGGAEEGQRAQLYRTSQDVLRLQRHLTAVRRHLSSAGAVNVARKGRVMSHLEDAELALQEAQQELTRSYDRDLGEDAPSNEEERTR